MRYLKSLLPFVTLIATAAALAGPVDINTADARTLAKELKGIGPARAEAIIKYRTQHGPFKSPDELALVKSIPQKVIDANRDEIRTTAESGTAGKDKIRIPAARIGAAAKAGGAQRR